MEALTDTQKDLIKEIALADFESGQFTTADFFIDDEEGDFTGVEQAAADYYQELVDMGPAGFYEEFADELDFDPDFVAEYGGCGFVRDFVDELDANNELTDEIYEQVTEGRNYSDYQLELVDDAIKHFIDDWRNDSGDIEAETAEEAKQIILNSIDDYLEPNLPDDEDDDEDEW